MSFVVMLWTFGSCEGSHLISSIHWIMNTFKAIGAYGQYKIIEHFAFTFRRYHVKGAVNWCFINAEDMDDRTIICDFYCEVF